MGVPEGETIDQVAARARHVIALVRAAQGRAALFGHGHALRILTACWLELSPAEARHFALGTASIGVLGYERETPAMLAWNYSFTRS
jgi:probable phosphoglycerate mutase